MRTARSTGRTVGMLLFLQLAGLIVPFVLLLPLTTAPQDWLANAAGAALQIRVAVFLPFANCALTIGITVTAFRILQPYSEAMAQWLFATSVCMFVLQAVDNVHVLSMLSLSQQYAREAGPDALFHSLAVLVQLRCWPHQWP